MVNYISCLVIDCHIFDLSSDNCKLDRPRFLFPVVITWNYFFLFA